MVSTGWETTFCEKFFSCLRFLILTERESFAIHMYVLSSEGLHTNQAFATAVVLLIAVILINAAASLLVKKIGTE